MPTLLARDAMSPPEQHGHGDQVPSIFTRKTSAHDPRHRIRGTPSRSTVRFAARGASVIHGEVPITHVAEAHELLDAGTAG
jgi:hypothetical protein